MEQQVDLRRPSGTIPAPRVITYCPLPYNGEGPAQSCVSVLSNFPQPIAVPELTITRSIKSIPVRVDQALGLPFRYMPWRLVSARGGAALNSLYRAKLEACDPLASIAYFWPDPPIELVERARARGLLAYREMTNCFRGSAKRILDEAYEKLGLKPLHGISEESVQREARELSIYDYVFASGQVEPTLEEAGVAKERVVPTAFGWSPQRFERPAPRRDPEVLRVLFVGTVCVGKGIPQLLEAWTKSKVRGELVIAGKVRDEIKPFLSRYSDDASIKPIGFVSDVGRLYAAADLFVFPSFVEGGPQVTYEAAGCGLPVITTPMGAGRLVRDGINGLVIEAGDADGMAHAMARLAGSAELRRAFSERAAEDAQAFTYAALGRGRAEAMAAALAGRRA